MDPGIRPDVETRGPGAGHAAVPEDEPVLRQAWLEEQAAVYQCLCEEPLKPSPVEFAARAVLPDGMGALNFDLRAKLIRRLRVLDGLNHALSQGDRGGGEDFQAGDV